MLDRLGLENFKCFQGLDIPLRPLTLLSGHNGGGKSSVIQSLVLLSQTLSEREWGRILLTEGKDLSLGTAADVINHRAKARRLSIGLSTSDEILAWRFTTRDRQAPSLELESVHLNGETLTLTDPLRWLLPAARAEGSQIVTTLRNLSWITAERRGPREILPLYDAPGHLSVGAHGELAAGLLHWRGADQEVTEQLCLSGIPSTLFRQVRGHMQEFFPNCDFKVTPIEGASAVTLHLRSDSRDDFQRPQNVGFGLTQLFPILVALLSAKPGSLLIVENPEVHLHPQAQQQIGLLLARVAASGVQLIVETHSDHVLNGVRLAAKTRAIPAGEVALHFFGRGDGNTQYASPVLDIDGRLNIWPEGFFDQFSHALSKLL